MAKTKVLVAYKSSGFFSFGDQIRIKNILAFLKNNNLPFKELLIPSLNRWSFFKSFHSILPINKGIFDKFSSKQIFQILDINVLMNSIKKSLLKLRPNVVLAETSLVGWAVTYVCEKVSVPCIVDCHGLCFAEEKGVGNDCWPYLKFLEEQAFTKCDYLIAVSWKMKDYIQREFGISPQKILVIPNGGQEQKFIAQYKLPLNVIYAGVFSYWEKIFDYLKIAKYADPQKFRFYMAGAGPLKKHILKQVRKEKIPIKYLGYIPYENIHAILSKMQIGIAPSTSDLARIVASPIKVFEYMASGLPVIAPQIGDWGDLIRKEGCGITINSDSLEEYINALNALTNKNVWIQKSQKALNLIKNKYSWDKILQPLFRLLSEY